MKVLSHFNKKNLKIINNKPQKLELIWIGNYKQFVYMSLVVEYTLYGVTTQ